MPRACAILLLAAPLAVAGDPYTGGDAAAMARAGYVSFGPFPFGDGHDTEDVERVVGGATIRWVETAHFRIGSSMEAYEVPRGERDALRADLEALAGRLDGVDPRAEVLDPWLRLHLLALRAERLYAEVAALLGVDGDDPPFLGQPGKYTVLMFERASDFGRYSARWMDGASRTPRRHHFPETGSLFFGTAVEFGAGGWRSDEALAGLLAFNLSHNLLAGYKGYRHVLPLWIVEGLAHRFQRDVTRRWNCYSGASDPDSPRWDSEDWAPKVRARVKFEIFPDAETVLGWYDPNALTFNDHMMLWARADFLASARADGLAAFLSRLSDPLPYGVPPPLAIAERQREALREAFDFDAAAFDEAWTAWVLRTYPKR